MRDRASACFRAQIATLPVALAALTATLLACLSSELFAGAGSTDGRAPAVLFLGALAKPLLVLGVSAIAYFLLTRHRLPAAYRTKAAGGGGLRAEAQTALLLLPVVLAGALAPWCLPGMPFPGPAEGGWLPAAEQGLTLGILATAVYGYRWRRFRVVRRSLRGEPHRISYRDYAGLP